MAVTADAPEEIDIVLVNRPELRSAADLQTS